MSKNRINKDTGYFSKLEKLLSTNKEYLVEDKLNKNKILEEAYKHSEKLLDLLLSSKHLKKIFSQR